MYRDAGGVDLCHAGVGKVSTFLVALPSGRSIGGHCIGGEKESIAVAAGGDHHRVGCKPFKLTGNQVAGDDAAGATINNHQVHHLVAGVKLHLFVVDGATQCGVGPKQKLLASLTAGVEGARNLCTTEGAVVEQTAIFTGKGHSLCHTLVDDAV